MKIAEYLKKKLTEYSRIQSETNVRELTEHHRNLFIVLNK